MNSHQVLVPAVLTGVNWPNSTCSNLVDACLDMGDLNEYRITRVAEVLSDFRDLQYRITSANTNCPSQTEYYTPAWNMLRQCLADAKFILDCSADVSLPVGRNEHEQKKLELQHLTQVPALRSVLLDAYARRHEAQKIYLRQMAAQRCTRARKQILDSAGYFPQSNEAHLHTCDVQLQQEVQQITDEFVYLDMLSGDQRLGRWTVEDPGLYDLLNWLSTRS
ncbi:hypothetical protein BBAD15_g2701 [Beauveria bassiana D1-5]|uniref:Uncharacterized protein n=1 Tax=Beauveria bassiana D1-5 TaxID=1245745 RepID=A0A0A2VV98_BEABA|nr:hypothetical protein BBAD15_g2701 [Beauveria bassiana D1-5]